MVNEKYEEFLAVDRHPNERLSRGMQIAFLWKIQRNTLFGNSNCLAELNSVLATST